MTLNFPKIAVIGTIIVLGGTGTWLISQRAGIPTTQEQAQPTVKSQPTFSDRKKRDITVGDERLFVEVVTTSRSIEQGLSGRSEIGADGMLFVFQTETMPSFWMKEMRIDLDLVWIRDGKIVGITQNVPHPSPNTPVTKLPLYSPSEPVDMVLEVESERWSFQNGDIVRF